jgi:hypothetical protein
VDAGVCVVVDGVDADVPELAVEGGTRAAKIGFILHLLSSMESPAGNGKRPCEAGYPVYRPG